MTLPSLGIRSGPAGSDTRAPVIAQYTAVASVMISRSAISATPALASAARGALETDPKYAVWPLPTLKSHGLAASTLDDALLILSRLKLLFDFGTSAIPAESAKELGAAIDAQWPALAASRAQLISGSGGVAYENIAITATLRADGDAEWGFERQSTARAPIPLSGLALDAQRPELDVFLQNLVRQDLQTRIEARLS